MWNHFETVEIRTNNNVEGDNLKMKCYCGAANQNMDKAVKLLKTFETTAEATYKNAKKSTAKPPYKRPEDRDRDTKFKQLKDLKINYYCYLLFYILGISAPFLIKLSYLG
jgi:hypothetical protein